MKRRRNAVIALGVVSAAGIVGMLLTDGAPDALFFALAALPLGVGGYRYYVLRGANVERD